MLELDGLINQVLENCTISDSRYAGVFSVCGLALRLRDLYKWENGLEPWVEKESAEILEWIGDKEVTWEALNDKKFNEIEIFDRRYDPFDAKGINSVLEPEGLFYGAGYVHSLKPSFFLAALEDKKELDGHPLFLLGRELARDLFTVPALVQDGCVLIRKESVRRHLWDKIFFVTKSGRPALRFALDAYGVDAKDPETLRTHLDRISESEMNLYIHHEIGELQDTVFDPTLWREIIAAFPHTPIELLARGSKDLLADTNPYGTLRHITREQKAASLGFYVAFLDGFEKSLFPELIGAFQEFMKTSDWKSIQHAVSIGYRTATYYAETLCGIFRKGKKRGDMKWTSVEIETRLLSPLGVRKNKSMGEGSGK